MHERCEWKLRTALGETMDEPHSEYDTDETDQVTDVYAEFCLSTIETMRRSSVEPLILIEERLDYSHIAPQGFGTGDLVLVGKDEDGTGLIHVIDFKGGRGVRVEAEMNSQMMLYAAAALNSYGFLVDPEIIRMSIVQPRLDNISTFQMTVEELNAWAESIKPIARMAFEGKGEQHTGDWCIFCKAKPVCRACAEEALSLAREEFLDLDEDVLDSACADTQVGNDEAVRAEQAEIAENNSAEGEGLVTDSQEVSNTANSTALTDTTAPYILDRDTIVFKSPQLIPIDTLASLMPSLTRIGSWIEAVFAYISAEVITHGVTIPGYKIVEGRSRRVFSDEYAAANAAEAAGVTNIYKTEMKSLSEIEKMMGKERFAEVLGEYVLKPPGKLALVPEDDPRPAADNTLDARGASATDEFDVIE